MSPACVFSSIEAALHPSLDRRSSALHKNSIPMGLCNHKPHANFFCHEAFHLPFMEIPCGDGATLNVMPSKYQDVRSTKGNLASCPEIPLMLFALQNFE